MEKYSHCIFLDENYYYLTNFDNNNNNNDHDDSNNFERLNFQFIKSSLTKISYMIVFLKFFIKTKKKTPV